MMLGILVLLASMSGGVGSTCSVELTVEAKATTVDISASGAVNGDIFEVRIRNLGPLTVTLVDPGDDSDVGWRTPIVTWQVELVAGVYDPPKLGRCGNINVLHPEEVFDLQPGESHVCAKWIPAVWVTQAGTYKLRFRYENAPHLKWSGIPLGEHDPDAMRRVRNSTACVAVSNEVVVEVTGTPPNWMKKRGA